VKKALRIGSRGSQLALWQANHVAGLLRSAGFETEIEIIKTTGDKITDVTLAKVGTKGMFTKEIEEGLERRQVDLAVHSLKDLPTDLPAGFKIGAVLKREDARDVFISLRYPRLRDLPRGARVGTSSLRREAQLRALRNDLLVEPLRGNVDTRLRKLESGDFDGIILAAAGVTRLGRENVVREFLEISEMCPAAGQGALAIEVRERDMELQRAITFLDNADARSTTECERACLRTLGGGCQVPIGAHARLHSGALELTAVVARPDGSMIIREEQQGNGPQQLGRAVGEALLRRGAQTILDQVYGKKAAVPQQP
jgi:hydroxymethylbilane synthase